ncbi:flavin monoamine oxidase family protein [Pontibacter liquoris]|uniref:flavin monoamine oxidase family protein n=1 Tax=Pontibacter liquoris TaxID=2905677 RepID=UPI001FA7EBD8|nr:NAD(P)/FAD-dependent oxidoreductase [Pontibacter liquoris]
MIQADILIIGAGAAGLQAARTLAAAGRQVAVLEARHRIGGRVYTFKPDGFSVPIEAGAEFIHGDLPLTNALLQEAHMTFQAMAGSTYEVQQGMVLESEAFLAGFDEMLARLQELTQDMSLAAFLAQYFQGETYAALRESVTKFAEGYDAADIQKLSAMAFREEWLGGGALNSSFPHGGYGQAFDFLYQRAKAAGATFHLAQVVEAVHWQAGQVRISCRSGQQFTAARVLVTVPLGVLLSEPGSEGYIRFAPALPEHAAALQQLGFGPVIKIILEFRHAFWQNEALQAQARQLPALSFLLSDATPVPTWWTHLPDNTPLLTGWLAGPQALHLHHLAEDALVEQALASLAYIFATSRDFLNEQLVAKKVVNWVADPYARGAYAYATVNATEAMKVLCQPVQETVYFAGEALYQGHAMGTVEAALASGLQAANRILGDAGAGS